jgi:hypothetical protein
VGREAAARLLLDALSRRSSLDTILVEAARAAARTTKAILSSFIGVGTRHGLDTLLGAEGGQRRLGSMQLNVFADSASLLGRQRPPLGELLSLELSGHVIVFKTLLSDGGHANAAGTFDRVVGLLIVAVVRAVPERLGNDALGEGRRGETSRVRRD